MITDRKNVTSRTISVSVYCKRWLLYMESRWVIPKKFFNFFYYFSSSSFYVNIWVLDFLHWCGGCVQYCAEHGEGQQCRTLFPLYTAAPDAYTQWLLGQVTISTHKNSTYFTLEVCLMCKHFSFLLSIYFIHYILTSFNLKTIPFIICTIYFINKSEVSEVYVRETCVCLW